MALRSFHTPQRQTAHQIEALFARQRREDPVGVPIHLACALAACFLAGWSTSVVDWAALGVLACFLVRMTGWHGLLEPLAYDRLMWALLAWGAWAGVSVAWSYARVHGGHEWVGDIQSFRFWPLPLLLWPVIDRRAWLVIAMMAGIASGQMSQIVHLLATHFDWAWVPIQRAPGRISGWWDPVVGGSVLSAGLGLWLALAFFAAGTRPRLLGTLGAAATVGCIVLTGTRGAWIAAALLCISAACIAAWRGRGRWILWLGLGAAALAVVLAAVIFLATTTVKETGVWAAVQQRAHDGVAEVQDALGADNYASDTGLRLAMWRWGVAAWKTHPVRGLGAGGYQPWVRAQNAATAGRLGAPAGAIPRVHAHAHSWYVHTGATLGTIGLVALAWLLVGAVRGGFRDSPARWTDVAPALGILGLAFAGLFDTITVNQQTAYVFYALVALCFPSRPRDISAPATVSGAGA